MKNKLIPPLHRFTASPLHRFTAPPLHKAVFLLLLSLFWIAELNAQGTEPQPPYDPCAPLIPAPLACFDDSRTCQYYEDPQFTCSPDYCWSSGGILPNQGIPPSGIVENKVIEIAGAYTITQGVTFSNCIFKMHGDSRINISPINPLIGSPQISFIGCKFFGCNEMWWGIYLNTTNAPNTLFFFWDCDLEDAYVGLELDESGAGYSIADSDFRNNYIGIRNRQQNGMALNASIIRNNFFQTAGLATIVGTLGGADMPDHPTAHAGIEYRSTNTSVGVEINPLGPQQNTGNVFSCLKNGIISDNSTLFSVNNTFQRIAQYGIWVLDGSIYAQSCKFQFDGYIAMYTEAANIIATANVFKERWNVGIYSIFNANAERISIIGNNFGMSYNSWSTGIYVSRPQATLGKNQIARNDFRVSAELSSLRCIQVDDPVTATDVFEIVSNTISITSAVTGTDAILVNLGASDNLHIKGNTIEYLKNSYKPSNYGIAIEKDDAQAISIGNRLEGNIVTGATSTDFETTRSLHCAFHMGLKGPNGIKSTTFCDNTVDNSRWGFHFFGGNNIDFSENHINHHSDGLFIVSGTIGRQYSKGNKWNTDPDACTNFAAKNSSVIPISSEFIVDSDDEGTTLPWIPPSAKIDPDPSLNGNPNWFHNDDKPLAHCMPNDDEPLPRILTPYEEEAVLGTSSWSGVDLWDLKRDVYIQLLLFPTLRPSGSPEEAFFNSLNNTSIAAFSQVVQQVRNALAISATDQAAYDAYQLAIDEAFEDLAVLDANSDYTSPSTQTSTWFSQRATLLQQVATHANNRKVLESTRQQQLQTALQSVLTFNGNITTTTAYETSRKTLYDLKIRFLKAEPITQSSYQQILALAQQDVSVVGNASAEAVHLLAPCDQFLFRHDDVLEERNSIGHEPHKPGLEVIQVTPNPSTNIVALLLPQHQTAWLRIFDAQGRLAVHQAVGPQQTTVQWEVNKVPSGIYLAVLSDSSGQTLATAKISVSH